MSDDGGGWAAPGSDGTPDQPPPPPGYPPPQPTYPLPGYSPPPVPPSRGTITFSGPGPSRPTGGDGRTGPLPLHPMTLSDILDGAFKLYKANARGVLTVTAAITVPIQIVSSLITVSASRFGNGLFSDPGTIDPGTTGPDLGANIGAVLVGLASVLVVPFVTGAISRIVAASYLGQSLPPRLALRATLRRFPGLLGAWFLVHLVEGSVILGAGLIGAIALVAGATVVGVIALVVAATAGSLAALGAMALLQATAPAIVVEEIGPVQGMRRSWRLMKPRFWAVMGIAVLSGLMASFLGSVLGTIPSFIGLLLPAWIGWIPIAAGGTLTSLVTTPFIAIVATLVYFDGRIRHEGFDLEVMAADLARAPD